MLPDFPQELVNALSSPSICDNKTSSALEQLLVLNAPQCYKNSIQGIRTKTPLGSTVAKTKTKVTKLTRNKAIAVLDENISQLDQSGQYSLAIQVVNSVLKTLTSQVKNRSDIQETPSDREASSLHISSPQKHLRDTSPNQCGGSVLSSEPEKKKKAGTESRDVRDGLKEIARCGSLAFEFLAHKRQNVAAQSRNQLETGIYAFIGRLIDLGMGHMALVELRKSHQRLTDLLSVENRDEIRRRTDRIDKGHSPENNNAASLLSFERFHDPSGEIASLLIGHQFLVLKHLVAFQDSAALVESIVYLRRSYISSPLNLLFTSLTHPRAKQLAAQKLEVLAKILLTLASSTTPRTGKANACPSSKLSCVIFEMQTLAQEARLLWMSSSGHCGNLDTEVLRTLSKHLASFLKSASVPLESIYAFANRLITNVNLAIKEARQLNKNLLLKGPTSMELQFQLSHIAEKAGLYAEALDILDATGDTVGCAFNDTLSCIWSCRKAAMLFKHYEHLKGAHEPLKALIQAWEDLRNTSNGTDSQLRQVLEEMNSLRSCVTTYLKASSRLTDLSPCSPLSEDLKRTSILYMVECLRFVRKYAGSSLPAELGEASQSQESACPLVVQLLQPCIESILYALLMVINPEQESWILVDESLQECLALVEFMIKSYRHVLDMSTRSSPSTSLMLSRISSVYWNCHLVLRRNPLKRNMIGTTSSLQKSIDILKLCDSAEQTAAALPYRIYKLAMCDNSSMKAENAEKAFHDCIRTSISLGALELLDPQCTHECGATSWASNEKSRELAKFLREFLTFTLRNPLVVQAFYDDHNLTYDQRGLLLERQLWEISLNGQENMVSCNAIAAQLLQVSERNTSSIQLMRATLYVLRLSNLNQGTISSTTSTKAASVAIELLQSYSLHKRSLSASVKHLYASLGLELTLRRQSSELGFVQEAIGFWRSLCEQTKDKEQLTEIIGDLSTWTSSLKTLGSFLELTGNAPLEILTLDVLLQVRKRVEPQDHQYMAYLLCKLSVRCSQAGLITKAAAYLADAGQYLALHDPSAQLHLEVELASGEVALAGGDYEKANRVAVRLRTLLDSPANTGLSSESRREKKQYESAILISNIFRFLSHMFWQIGSLMECLLFAKRSVAVMQYAWARLEFQHSKKESASMKQGQSTDPSALAEELSHLSMQPGSTLQLGKLSTTASSTPASWSVLASLSKGFLHLSHVFQHLGSYQDAIHYAEQCLKLSTGSNIVGQAAEALLTQGDYQMCSGKIDESEALFNKAGIFYNKSNETIETSHYHQSLGILNHGKKDWKSELKAYKDASAVLQRITQSEGGTEVRSTIVDRTNALLAPVVASKPSVVNKESRKPRALVKHSTEVKKQEKHKGAEEKHISSHQLLSLQNTLKGLEARSYIAQGDLETAHKILTGLSAEQDGNDCRIRLCLANLNIFLGQAFKSMATDPVYSILSESTISIPATKIPVTRRASQSGGKLSLSKRPTGRTVAHPSPQKGRKQPPVKQSAFKDILLEASEELMSIQNDAVEQCAMATAYQFQSSASDIAMVLSATNIHSTYQETRSESVARSLELPRAIAWERDQMLIKVNLAEKSIVQPHEWPVISQNDCLSKKSTSLEAHKDLSNSLPATWTTMSLTLSECQNHLYLVQYRAQHSPFLLRLPLNRQNAHDVDDEDEESFGYDDARGELIDIIRSSDATVHQARDNPDLMQSKGAKTQWWAERELLDQRLRNLVTNMQNLWFGGFRGIFSGLVQHPDLLEQFQKSFDKTLEKHLPSRQRAAKRQQISCVELDARIYGLFIGLGEGADEETDLEEPLTDLLYFVVDILQFNGEANAYDEIDFDSMIIETVDAINTYHDSTRQRPSNAATSHIILVLDKRLHAFPWESMPCLEGQSVSRVPSLLCLHERMLSMQAQKDAGSTSPGYEVNPASGTYMLNPSGDLSKTQSRFEKPLSALTSAHDTWSSIIARAPSEPEFANALTSPDSNSLSLLLYFGHGSGAQYIRSKTVRALAPRCGVALLFGCSSVSLQEVGQFEPYGTPKTYLAAGSPAVLGSLWDVTDGDVDKFAAGVLERWGLLERGSCAVDVAAGAKSRGGKKGKVVVKKENERSGNKVTVDDSTGRMSLSCAVAKSRGECYLRYLNGAAMVVYGVPVYLRE